MVTRPKVDTADPRLAALLDSEYRAGVLAGWNAAQLPPAEAEAEVARLRQVTPGWLAAIRGDVDA